MVFQALQRKDAKYKNAVEKNIFVPLTQPTEHTAKTPNYLMITKQILKTNTNNVLFVLIKS